MNRLQRVIDRLQEVVNKGKKLWHIAAVYDSDRKQLRSVVDEVHRRLGEHTVIHGDLHYKEQDMIIVVGRYRNRDYVRAFFVDPKSFRELIEILKQVEPYSRVGHFDTPGYIPFSAVYDREQF